MKKLFKALLIFILVFSFTACGSSKKSSGKVKVYIFEAGGCPYCEAQIQYLESLEENGKKFEIVKKELYVDHVDWEIGKDYDLGVKVAVAFQKAGYKDASYQGTPFVVISDIYATAAYSTDLLDYINKAYEEGDNDIVGCYEKDKKCDIREFETETDKKIDDVKSELKLHVIIIYVLIGLVILYLVYGRCQNNNNKTNNVVIKKSNNEEKEVKEVKVEKKTNKKKKK